MLCKAISWPGGEKAEASLARSAMLRWFSCSAIDWREDETALLLAVVVAVLSP